MVKQEQLKNIFTVKTTGSHKQISIFGIKISIKIPQDKNIEIVTQNYQKVLNRIKNKPNSKKIKVLFLINDISKWKTKSLYNLMKNSLDFEPIIALTLGDNQWELNSTEKNTLINNNKQYFNSQGIDCIIAYNLEQEEVISLKTFNPDIIFYQQPYQLSNIHKPLNVSEFALTYYVPYYIPNYWLPNTYWLNDFHCNLFKYYQPNEKWINLLTKFITKKQKIKNNNLVAVGHTMLDEIRIKKNNLTTKNYVIYAPHWSFKHRKNKNPEYYSTFPQNHKEILEYAKSHPEFNWVFKPHPTLKYTLTKTKYMTKEEIDNYYKEWEHVGICSYDSNYIDLFLNSKTLITDCGSFTIEYFATEKPLIHLISKDCKVKPPRFMQKIYNTFYKVKNKKELFKTLDEILIKDNDHLKDERKNILKEHTWINNYCAEMILKDIRNTINETSNNIRNL